MAWRTISEESTAHIVQGGLRYHWHPRAFLSRRQARYALGELWRLLHGPARWHTPVRLEIAALAAPEVQALFDLPARAMPWLRVAAVLPPGNALRFDADCLPGLCAVGNAAEARFGGTEFFPIDLVTATFLMLTRWEEVHRPGPRDRYDRAQAVHALAHRQEFLDRPIIDEWAAVAREWLRHWAPNEPFAVPEFRDEVWCDVDRPLKYPTAAHFAIHCGKDVVRGEWRRSGEWLHEAWRRWREGWRGDPFGDGLRQVLSLCEERGIRCRVCFMTAAPGKFDRGYDLRHPSYRAMLEETMQRGHEVGFHPGYGTHLNREELRAQLARLTEIVGGRVAGGRQHYMRFKVPDTWRLWAEAGLTYDATLMYAEAPGFRCGTCHPFGVYDVERDRRIPLLESPPAAMDCSVKNYLGLAPDEALVLLRKLRNRCQAVGGVFSVAVHNNYPAEWRRVLKALLRESPSVAEVEYAEGKSPPVAAPESSLPRETIGRGGIGSLSPES